MKFSQFCEMAENTEKEQQLLQFLKEDEMKTVEQILAKMTHIPFAGKICAAVVALINSESIAAFKQSGHYRQLMNMDFNFDFDKRSLQVSPSDAQKEQIKKAFAMIGGGIALLLILRKLFRRKK